ncbi:phosphatase PAP2 family protein [Hellea balneolensis]|uniref:phosphatase PAP2 family protein n=1 Tax=Hellea balneolensis TaxID=287478 RepID=UPI0003FFE58B|nr:phosphatase PAP2 family protein [Hellea balneolensis]
MADHISSSFLPLESKPHSFARLLRQQLRTHAFLIMSCIIYFIIAVIITTSLGKDFGFSAWPYLEMIFVFMVPLTFMASLIAVFFYMAIVKKPKHLTRAFIEFYRPLILSPPRWAKAIPAIGVMMLGFMAFTEMKSVIPLLNPYGWDIAFMEMDRLLHFGQDPWRLLQPLFGSNAPTLMLNFIYNLWFFVMFGFWLCSGWTKSDQGWERQFLLSFIWCWIIGGTVLATLFSSMGPAFYDLVNAPTNPYASQMAFLGSINESHEVLALGAQDMLRAGYLNPSNGGLSGISAMPSLHNATSTLFMLAAYRINKGFGHVMMAFLICIMIGSVHLAWHYAVDAYLGILIALIIWFVSGRALMWQDKLFKVQEPT